MFDKYVREWYATGKSSTGVMNRIILIIILLGALPILGCTEKSPTEKPVEEYLPNFSLITDEGKITSNRFLQDDRPEFLLFISPY